MIHEVLEAMNLPILGVPGYEADDVMVTVARPSSSSTLDQCRADVSKRRDGTGVRRQFHQHDIAGIQEHTCDEIEPLSSRPGNALPGP